MKTFNIFIFLVISSAPVGLQSMGPILSNEDIVLNNYLEDNLSTGQLFGYVEEEKLIDDSESYSSKLKALHHAAYANLQDNLYLKSKNQVERAATLCRKLPKGTQISTLRQKIRSIINGAILELKQLIQDGAVVTRPNSSSPKSFPLILMNHSGMKLEYKTASIPATELFYDTPVSFDSIPKSLEMRKVKPSGAKGSWHSLTKPLATILLNKNSKTGKSALIIYDSAHFNPLEWNIKTR